MKTLLAWQDKAESVARGGAQWASSGGPMAPKEVWVQERRGTDPDTGGVPREMWCVSIWVTSPRAFLPLWGRARVAVLFPGGRLLDW